MTDESEGDGPGQPIRVEMDPKGKEAERLYRGQRKIFDGWLGLIPPLLRHTYTDMLTHSTSFQGAGASSFFRNMSRQLHGGKAKPSEMQEQCNDTLWTHNPDGTLNFVMSDDVVPLFKPGKPEEWPNLLLTANHARAGKSEDLVELMRGVEKLGGDAWGKPLDLYRLRHQESKKPNVAGKTILMLACHTERDIFLNGAELIDRRLALQEDRNKENPAKRTREHMSPASMRLAKLILKTMVEPDPTRPKLVDLARAKREHEKVPFVANDHSHSLVLRVDATSIAQHIKLVGYSKGAEAVCSALRFYFAECKALETRLQMREKDGTVRAVTDNDLKQIIGNIGLLSIAPGEVPLTKAEKDVVGIKRVTILNSNDYTAGHLVNPDKRDYDRWSDRLVVIEGTREEGGHSIDASLGTTGVNGARPKTGFIMNPSNTGRPNYKVAQDEVKAFFASNHRVQAITTACLSPEGADNTLYLQFAPGTSRANETQLAQTITAALHQKGFPDATVESDLTHRRRLRVVLDHDAMKTPIVTNDSQWNIMAVNHNKVQRCQEALKAFSGMSKGLFVASDVTNYLSELQRDHPNAKDVADPAQEKGAGAGKGGNNGKQ